MNKTLLKIGSAAGVLALAFIACAACYNTPSVLCKTAGSEQQTISCQVNCLCPHVNINQACMQNYTSTVFWTDSSNHSLACQDQGTDTDKCQIQHLANGCSYSKQVAECPSISPVPLTCIPTLTYEPQDGPRDGVITGFPCGG